MKSITKIKVLAITCWICSPLALFTSKANAGSFGAEIFCTMRDGGNDHESSWNAAYSYIKKQKGGFFKISPKQAAAQIVETVVREREKFSFCIEYLDKLHPNRQLQRQLQKEKAAKEKAAKEKAAKEKEEKRKILERELEREFEENNIDYSEEIIDRYSY